jgi:hypothetical protein
MRRLDQVTGAVLFVVSAYFLHEAHNMPFMTGKSPGSGWLPTWLAVLMALLSALLFLTATRRPASEDRKIVWPSGQGLANNIAILGGLAIEVVILETAGYLIATFAFLLWLLWFLGKYRWYFCLGMAGVTSFVLYYVFKVVLEIPLPSGFIDIL